MIVTDERVPKFVGERVGATIYPPFTAVGIERDGEIIGGVVFNCFTGSDAHVTVAGTGWTRGFLTALGKYAFWQLGCCRVTVITEHQEVVDLAKRLGGKVEGTLRDQFGKGRDGTILGILASEYRFRERAIL